MTRGRVIYLLNYCTAEFSIQCQLVVFGRCSCPCFPHLIQNQIMNVKNQSVVISSTKCVNSDTKQTCFGSFYRWIIFNAAKAVPMLRWAFWNLCLIFPTLFRALSQAVKDILERVPLSTAPTSTLREHNAINSLSWSSRSDDPDLGRQDDRYTERIPLSSLAQKLPFPLQSYRVLRLGIRRFDPPVSRTSDIIHLEYLMGLIVRQDGVGKDSPWYRVGFTSWLDWIRKDPLEPGNTIGEPEKIASRSADWQDIQCLIG